MSERDHPKPDAAEDVPVQPELTIAHSPPPSTGDVPMEPELQAFIGRQLQATHDEVLNQPIPDRFVELLRRLEQEKADEP